MKPACAGRAAVIAAAFVFAECLAAQISPDAPSLADAILDGGGPKAAERVLEFLESTEPGSAASRSGAGGSIETASARLAVLDRLVDPVAGIHPDQAIVISRLVAGGGDPEERVVALRNLAWLSEEDRSFVAEQLSQLLDGAPDGFAFAQALDGVVYLADPAFASWLAAQDPDGARGLQAAVALDRLAAANPAGVARQLNARPGLLADRPLARADLFTKGDLADPETRAEIERFLARRDVGDAEVAKFVGGYLQPGFFLVDGIFTRSAVPEDFGEGRRESLRAAAAEWRNVPALRRAADLADRALAGFDSDE